MARPTKYSEARARKICAAIAKGNTRRVAAALAGIDESTLYEWANQYPEFSKSLDHADAKAEAGYAGIFRKAALGYAATRTRTTVKADGMAETVTETHREFDWRAAESWLKRRRPDDWGDKIDVKQLPDDALIRLLNRATRQRGMEAGPADPPGAAGPGDAAAGSAAGSPDPGG
jgi:hypothetical protein